MKKRVADLSASVRQRLWNLATEGKEDFGLISVQIGERGPSANALSIR